MDHEERNDIIRLKMLSEIADIEVLWRIVPLKTCSKIACVKKPS